MAKRTSKKAPVKSWQEHAELIREAWRKSIFSVIETGKRVQAAHDDLGANTWEGVFTKKALPFDKSTANRLMKIARHPVLSDEAYMPQLPPSWATLYHLSMLEDNVLERAIKDKVVNDLTEQSDAKKLVRAAKAGTRLTKSVLTGEDLPRTEKISNPKPSKRSAPEPSSDGEQPPLDGEVLPPVHEGEAATTLQQRVTAARDDYLDLIFQLSASEQRAEISRFNGECEDRGLDRPRKSKPTKPVKSKLAVDALH